MTEHDVLCLGSRGFHRMHYYEWGEPENPRIVICVHGLTRNGRDFDAFASAVSSDFRVICPDVVGRGRSDWLEAKEDYAYAQYLSDLTALIARVTTHPAEIYWVGTSMGALLGIVLAAMPNHPIAKLVLNDAGPLVPKAALERLASYVGREPRFANIDDAEAHLRRVFAPFGALTNEQWRHLTVHAVQQKDDGTWALRYDPAIGRAFQGTIFDVDLWAQWDRVNCPALVLRGVDSDVLLHETALEMTRRGPRPRLVEFEGIGHAPMLMNAEQISAVRNFLLQG